MPLVDGQAQFTTSDLAVGSHSISAVYSGDANWNGSTSAPVTLRVTAPASISGLVFNDRNGNGARNSADSALAGWTVQLQDTSGTVLQTATTGSNGRYSFGGLAAGVYRVREVLPATWVQTTPNPPDMTLASGQAVAGVNFGNVVSADLKVAKTAQYNPATRRIVYTITVLNEGPAGAANVVMTDALAGWVSLVSASTSQGSCSGKQVVRCNLGTLPSGASATMTLTVKRTNLRLPVVNMALVTSSTFDVDKNDNWAAAAVIAASSQEESRPPTYLYLPLISE